MGYLSVPYKITYVGKNFRAGLTDVFAVVERPNGTQVGFFPMTEGTGAFSGIYTFDYISQLTDAQGEYTVLVMSPSETNKDIVRMSLYVPPNAEALNIPAPRSGPIGIVDTQSVNGLISISPAVIGKIGDDEILEGIVYELP